MSWHPKYKVNHWFNEDDDSSLYGVDIMREPCSGWMHLAVKGKPLFFGKREHAEEYIKARRLIHRNDRAAKARNGNVVSAHDGGRR